MRSHIHPNTGLRSRVALVAALCGVALFSSTAMAQITIQLRPDPVVGRREVLLSDVAIIRADSTHAAAAIGQVDIATIAEGESVVTVRKSFVKIRLGLAGWRSAVVVDGPESMAITFAKMLPITDLEVERAAEETLLSVMGVTSGDLRVRLTNPFMQSLPSDVRERSGLRVDVLAPFKPDLGQVSMTVRLWDGDQQVATRMGRFDVLKRQRVAVTRISLSREKTIESDDIQFENRFLGTVVDEPQENAVVGQHVRMNLAPGQMLSMRDLSQPKPTTTPAVIKARDKITATAISGGLRVQLARAEAMQDGRIGEMINVRNLDSNRTFTGKVVGAGEVEIRLR